MDAEGIVVLALVVSFFIVVGFFAARSRRQGR